MSKRSEVPGSRKPDASPKSKPPSQYPRASKKPSHFGNLYSIDEAGVNLSASSIPPPALKTRVPTQLSTAKGPILNRDKSMSPGTALSRGGSVVPGHAKSSAPGTILNRDTDPFGPGTTLNRDVSRLPKAQTILLTAVASKRPASTAPRSVPTILTLPKDKTMAMKQLDIEDMDPKERKAQEAWAKEQLDKNPSCPDKFKWARRIGGYQCEAGAHGITDSLLAEGRNGLIALRGKNWDDLEGWEGPYYPDPKRPGVFIRGELPVK